MTVKQKKILSSSYRRYRKKKKTQKNVFSFLRVFMPEIIFRTTRLEGERVTRRMISSLFK